MIAPLVADKLFTLFFRSVMDQTYDWKKASDFLPSLYGIIIMPGDVYVFNCVMQFGLNLKKKVKFDHDVMPKSTFSSCSPIPLPWTTPYHRPVSI